MVIPCGSPAPDAVFSESVDIVRPFLAGLPCDDFLPCILQLVIGAVHYVVMEAANVSDLSRTTFLLSRSGTCQ